MRYLVFILFCLSLSSCYQSIDDSVLPGRYESKNIEFMFDTLIIHSDKTYIYDYMQNDGKRCIINDKWEFNKSNNELTLINFPITSGSCNSGIKEGWTPKVENVNGEIRLIYSSDSYVYFYKIVNKVRN